MARTKSMELRDNYKIENDGIWIARSELEKWKKHYIENAYERQDKKQDTLEMFYYGKAEVLTDLLKMFEPLEGE